MNELVVGYSAGIVIGAVIGWNLTWFYYRSKK